MQVAVLPTDKRGERESLPGNLLGVTLVFCCGLRSLFLGPSSGFYAMGGSEASFSNFLSGPLRFIF